MAASVLLGSADNTGLNFTVGGGSSGTRTGNILVGSNNNGLGSVGPAPWNRSLDRALDEATATGCLNLSGRKLKEFPRSAANHDLTDTTRAGKFTRQEKRDQRGRNRDGSWGGFYWFRWGRNVESCTLHKNKNVSLSWFRHLPSTYFHLSSRNVLQGEKCKH